ARLRDQGIGDVPVDPELLAAGMALVDVLKTGPEVRFQPQRWPFDQALGETGIAYGRRCRSREKRARPLLERELGYAAGPSECADHAEDQIEHDIVGQERATGAGGHRVLR